MWGNYLYANNAPGVCGVIQANSPSQTFFIKRPVSNTSSSLTPQVGDLVYTDSAGTSAFNNGAVITNPMDDGEYVFIQGGTIQSVGNDNGCEGYGGN